MPANGIHIIRFKPTPVSQTGESIIADEIQRALALRQVRKANRENVAKALPLAHLPVMQLKGLAGARKQHRQLQAVVEE